MISSITRTQAARLLEELLLLAAASIHDRMSIDPQGIVELAKRYGLELPTACNGEAHRNPHIDNCMVCMPRWGWVGGQVRVR